MRPVKGRDKEEVGRAQASDSRATVAIARHGLTRAFHHAEGRDLVRPLVLVGSGGSDENGFSLLRSDSLWSTKMPIFAKAPLMSSAATADPLLTSIKPVGPSRRVDRPRSMRDMYRNWSASRWNSTSTSTSSKKIVLDLNGQSEAANSTSVVHKPWSPSVKVPI